MNPKNYPKIISTRCPKKSERDNEIQETRGKMQRRESEEDYEEEKKTVEVGGSRGAKELVVDRIRKENEWQWSVYRAT